MIVNKIKFDASITCKCGEHISFKNNGKSFTSHIEKMCVCGKKYTARLFITSDTQSWIECGDGGFALEDLRAGGEGIAFYTGGAPL